ncbi:MAG: response regulator transcription factor [Anaerolineae bacterium]|jgi:DNA-binding response OmpR family regulator|nr:response regulator transcription factor [Anaerolineae bacterium]
MNSIFNCKILIVDDEPELCRMVKTILQKEGFRQIITAADCSQSRQSFKEEKPDCVILDVSLPDGDGFTLLRELRTESPVPVLFLSARDEDQARLLGLGLGADDYITKPFLPLELVLRIKAILSRTYFPLDKGGDNRSRFYLGETEIDLDSGVVMRADGEQYTLTAKEFALLEKLHENAGKIVTIDSLCHTAWGENIYRYENTLMVHMRRLREKVEPDPSAPRYLLTVRGLGYKLDGAKDSK